MKIEMVKGVVCVPVEGGRLIVDTGSPISFADAPSYQLDGKTISLQCSDGLVSWHKLKEKIPFEVSGLIGTDQLQDKPFTLDILRKTLVWSDSLTSGEEFDLVHQLAVVNVTLNEKPQKFVLDTGAAISYVGDDKQIDGLQPVGTYHDFYPTIGEFESKLYEATIGFGALSARLKVGLLPTELSTILQMLQVSGIVGNDLLSQMVLHIDFSKGRIATEIGT